MRDRVSRDGPRALVPLIILAFLFVFVTACRNPLGTSADVRRFIEDGLTGSLSYDANGGNGPVAASVLYAYGDRVAAAGAGGLTKSGSFFGGWNASADGSGRPYAAGDVILMNQNDLVLYAQWPGTIKENGLVFTISGSTITDSQGVAYTLSDGTIQIPIANITCSGNVIIPASIGGYSVTVLASNAFSSNPTITGIIIPPSITSLSSSCFNTCSNLESVTLPDTLTTIEGNALAYCKKIKSIDIPYSLTAILLYAFHDCVGLETITLPAALTTIGYGAFMGCTALTTVTIKATTPPTINTQVFNGCTSLTKILVPAASLSDYQTAANWSAYAALMQGF